MLNIENPNRVVLDDQNLIIELLGGLGGGGDGDQDIVVKQEEEVEVQQGAAALPPGQYYAVQAPFGQQQQPDPEPEVEDIGNPSLFCHVTVVGSALDKLKQGSFAVK